MSPLGESPYCLILYANLQFFSINLIFTKAQSSGLKWFFLGRLPELINEDLAISPPPPSACLSSVHHFIRGPSNFLTPSRPMCKSCWCPCLIFLVHLFVLLTSFGSRSPDFMGRSLISLPTLQPVPTPVLRWLPGIPLLLRASLESLTKITPSRSPPGLLCSLEFLPC